MNSGTQRAPRGASDCVRLRLKIRGAVQGVGFRPFVYRLATSLGLAGWVNNSTQGVLIEVEGEQGRVAQFRERLSREKPAISLIQSIETESIAPVGDAGFAIRESSPGGSKTAIVLPDIATCPDCLREIFDPANRRHLYPFTNCTHCGPRFSIIESLPYDRPNTTMKSFAMCDACRAEYEDPHDRRFHAQPNACPVCGPHLELWDQAGRVLAGGCTHQSAAGLQSSPTQPLSHERSHTVLHAAAAAIREGRIVAVKGLGGFHLMVAAHLEDAVRRLRERKHREEKPLALMFPTLDQIKAECAVSELETRLLTSAQAPIVLLRRQGSRSRIASAVAPGNPYLGVMLPYTPLHHLLLRFLDFPVVATSGNLSDEPICINEQEALRRLNGIADLFLVHNRPIVRHVDDSVVRVVAGRETVLRRARGYAPLPVLLNTAVPPTLAVGAHLKNTVAVSVGAQVFLSQHIGDLETEEALGAFRRVIADFQRFYEVKPTRVAADAHPDYLSTQHARQTGLPLVSVQHHYAHILACLAEHGLTGEVLGVSWDGTGFGTDATVWGGEFLVVKNGAFERFAHLRTFRLPGGEAAVKEPRRSALGVLFELFGEAAFERRELAALQAFSEVERKALRQMLARGVNAPITSSAGRLFDAVASLVGLRQRVVFEGQAAMELEWALDGASTTESYPLDVAGQGSAAGQSLVLDWAPLIRGVLQDLRCGLPPGVIALKFHRWLVDSIIAVAQRAGRRTVVLSGGCFQNLYLAEQAILRLREAGFEPLWHQHVPPNDGGIALGQVVASANVQ